MPIAAGIIIAMGNTSLQITKNLSLAGIAFGTLINRPAKSAGNRPGGPKRNAPRRK